MGRNKTIDLAAVITLPDLALIDEKMLAALKMSSLKKIQKDRAEGRGCPFVRDGRSVRYRIRDARQHLANLPEFGPVAAPAAAATGPAAPQGGRAEGEACS